MSLRARLLLSYLLLIAISLGVILGTLLIALGARPAPPLTVWRQLLLNMQVGLRSPELAAAAQAGLAGRQPQQRIETLLAQYAEAADVRILLVAGRQTTRVVYDSNGIFSRDARVELLRDEHQEHELEFPARFRRGAFAGRLSDPDGARWLFIALQPPGQIRTPQALLFALRQPRQSLGEALNEFSAALATPLLQAALMGVLAALLMAVLVSRTIARPLLQIAEATRAIAQGRYGQRVPLSGPPEIRAVARAFNHMSAEVQAAQQAQQDLLLNVSHDLRTPLTSIQGYSQAIVDGTAREAAAAGRVIHEEAARLNRMVDDITGLARLQDRRLPLNPEMLDLNALLAGVSRHLAILARERSVALRLAPGDLPLLRGDGDRLAQALGNVIGNALRFTPVGGQVYVSSRTREGGAEVSVTDEGIGIPPAELERIFERFYQVDKTRGPARGSGLGLAIAREIVNAHGGHIAAFSDGPGRGSRFVLWLPFSGPATDDAPDQQAGHG